MPNLAFDFEGRTIVVTGAARGIGLAIASSFARAGGAVIAADLDEDVLVPSAQEIGATAVVADVASSADAERVVATALDQTGRVDVVVNNAGILRDSVLWKLDDSDWEAVLGVHLGGTFRFTRACVPHFRRHNYGRVVNVTVYGSAWQRRPSRVRGGQGRHHRLHKNRRQRAGPVRCGPLTRLHRMQTHG